jgi:hypothetical protein
MTHAHTHSHLTEAANLTVRRQNFGRHQPLVERAHHRRGGVHRFGHAFGE